MTIDEIINKLSEFFSWLYHRPWERWQILAIVITTLVTLIIIVKAHLKVVVNKKRLRERSPIIGIQKADRKTRR